jgi:hypothetical protein
MNMSEESEIGDSQPVSTLDTGEPDAGKSDIGESKLAFH